MTDYPCICILSVGKLKPKYFQYNWNTERTWANCFQKLKFLSIKLWLLENHYANSSLISIQIIQNDIQCIFWNSSNGITELRADGTKTTTMKNEKFAISANIQIQIGVVKHALSTVFNHFKANQFVICACVCVYKVATIHFMIICKSQKECTQFSADKSQTNSFENELYQTNCRPEIPLKMD